MAISPEEFERLPLFLQNFLREQGAAPDLGLTSTPVSTPSAAPLLPPLPRNAEVANEGGGLFEGSRNSPSFLSPEAESAMWSRGWDNVMGQNGLGGQISSIGNDIASVPGQIANAPSDLMNGVAGFFNSVEPAKVSDLNDYRAGYDYQQPGNLVEQIFDGPTSFSSLGNTYAGIDRVSALRGESGNLGRKIGATAVPIISTLMSLAGASTFPIALLGGLFNTLGGYHDYDPNADSNITIDPETGLVDWDSTNMGGGGMQSGMLNAENFVESLAARDPNMWMHTGITDRSGFSDPSKGFDDFGQKTYSNIQDLSDYMSFNRQANNPNSEFFMMDAYNDPTYAATTDTPWSYADSKYANLTNETAMQSLSNRTGNAYNSVASNVYANGGGYNDIAPAVEMAKEALQAEAWHAANFGTGGNSGLGEDYDRGVSSYTGRSGDTSGSGEGSDTGIGGDDDWDF